MYDFPFISAYMWEGMCDYIISVCVLVVFLMKWWLLVSSSFGLASSVLLHCSCVK